MSDSRPVGTVTFRISTQDLVRALIDADMLPDVVDREYLAYGGVKLSVRATVPFSYGHYIDISVVEDDA